MNDQDLDKYVLPLIQKKIIQRSCKGPISIKRIDPTGDYIVIENTSIKKPVVLTNWILRRRGVDVPINSFKFEKHFVLHPNRQVKIYANEKGQTNLPHELMSDTVSTWGSGTYAYTQLVNHLNQEKACLLEKVEHYERDLITSPSIKVTKNTNQDQDEFIDRNVEFHYHKTIRN